MTTPISLTGKRILVTGGARGLGHTFVKNMVGAGAKVALADILVKDGQAAASDIGASFFELDLGQPESIETCMDNFITACDGRP